MRNEDAINPAMSEAVDWVVRFTSGEATHDDLRAFEAWREADARNDAAFRAIGNVRQIAQAVRGEKVSRRGLLGGGVAATAAVILAGLARPPLGLWPSFDELMADHRTGPGQKFAFSPATGVQVEMNSRTSVDLLADGEGIRLIDGEAFVSIARGAGFRLEARNARFIATKATVNVDTLAGGVRLTCLEGEVECRVDDRVARIAANQQWRLNAEGAAAVNRVDAGMAAGWRQGVLQFNRTPLGEVVEKFNRYRSVPIMLTGSVAASQPVSGIFYTDDTDAAVAQLQQLLHFRVRHLPGNAILIS